jgi:hypothetical protein
MRRFHWERKNKARGGAEAEVEKSDCDVPGLPTPLLPRLKSPQPPGRPFPIPCSLAQPKPRACQRKAAKEIPASLLDENDFVNRLRQKSNPFVRKRAARPRSMASNLQSFQSSSEIGALQVSHGVRAVA